MRDKRQSGYTIIDFAMMLGVLAVLGAVSLPPAMEALRTYRRNAAARHLVSEIRAVQSLAVTRGGVFGLEWGAAGSPQPSDRYRIVRDTTGVCGFPAAHAPLDGANVIRDWANLSDQYSEITIESIRDSDDHSLGFVMFDAMGASMSSCSAVSFPVTVTLVDEAGGRKTIEIRRSGIARLR